MANDFLFIVRACCSHDSIIGCRMNACPVPRTALHHEGKASSYNNVDRIAVLLCALNCSFRPLHGAFCAPLVVLMLAPVKSPPTMGAVHKYRLKQRLSV